jgi:methylated-DNA-[protein]-cysteine S-methyltransferase
MRHDFIQTKWGVFAFVVSDDGLTATFLPQPWREARLVVDSRFPKSQLSRGMLPGFRNEIIGYFSGRPVTFGVELDLSGVPPFWCKVLEACRRIPFGQTATYADLARAAGNPAAVRAAGSAMANNPMPLVIPCHRVLCSDGRIGGFSSPQGVRQKLRLLENEGIAPPRADKFAGSGPRRGRAAEEKGRLVLATGR